MHIESGDGGRKNSVANSSSQSSDVEHTTVDVNCAVTASSTRLLGTAQVILQSPHGSILKVRALIDPCAESSFISERAIQSLNVKKRNVSVTIFGVGASPSAQAIGEASLTLRSPRNPDFSLDFVPLVLPNLTRKLPKRELTNSHWKHIDGLELADPLFYKPLRVD